MLQQDRAADQLGPFSTTLRNFTKADRPQSPVAEDAAKDGDVGEHKSVLTEATSAEVACQRGDEEEPERGPDQGWKDLDRSVSK